MLQEVFQNVQVIGVSQHYQFRGGTSGDTLIMAIVGTPLKSALAMLPPLDSCSPSVVDVFTHRFGSDEKRKKEMGRFLSNCYQQDLEPCQRRPTTFFEPTSF